MLTLRDVFQSKELLIVKYGSPTRIRWLGPDQVIRKCPSFVRSTIQIPDFKSVYYESLCNMLDLPVWKTEIHLRGELESSVASMRSEPDWQNSIPRYVFTALSSIVQEGHFRKHPNRNPPWILSILRLPIFPILTKHQTVEITTLSPDIFVPDSELLNEQFKGKVNLLYFGDRHVRDLLPVLRCSDVDLKYVSAYDDPTTMDLKVIEPVDVDIDISSRLWGRREALTRWSRFAH